MADGDVDVDALLNDLLSSSSDDEEADDVAASRRGSVAEVVSDSPVNSTIAAAEAPRAGRGETKTERLTTEPSIEAGSNAPSSTLEPVAAAAPAAVLAAAALRPSSSPQRKRKRRQKRPAASAPPRI